MPRAFVSNVCSNHTDGRRLFFKCGFCLSAARIPSEQKLQQSQRFVGPKFQDLSSGSISCCLAESNACFLENQCQTSVYLPHLNSWTFSSTSRRRASPRRAVGPDLFFCFFIYLFFLGGGPRSPAKFEV